jgi:hypothetical protein
MEQLFYERIVKPAEATKIDRMMRPVVLARSNNNKRTIGVMNEFVRQLKAQLASEYHFRTSFAELNRLANVLPVGRGKSGGMKYLMPGEEMAALINSSGVR